jgi:cell pole-organizing protein PopZ
MLKLLRNKKTAKKIWIGLAIIIIPAFAFWGFGSADKQDKSSVIGKIFGRNVTAIEFNNSLIAVRTSALMQFGDRLEEIEKYLNFEGQAWERLILLAEAKRRRIRVSDQEVIEQIQNAPYFQDQKGFSNKIYQETLRYVLRLQPRIYEEQTRQSLILNKLYEQVTKNYRLTDEQIRQEYLQANQELSIDYIASSFADFAGSVQPTDEQIASFFEKNKPMFKEPATENQPVRIPELSEIKDKVRSALADQTAKEMALQKINECAQNLKTMDFNRAAAACKLKVTGTDYFKSTGLIENLHSARNFWNTAKNLKENETSGVISNARGYYLIKLKSIKPIDESKFAQERAAFSEKLLSSKKAEMFGEFVEQLRKKAQ